jgi:hypothetical protein
VFAVIFPRLDELSLIFGHNVSSLVSEIFQVASLFEVRAGQAVVDQFYFAIFWWRIDNTEQRFVVADLFLVQVF